MRRKTNFETRTPLNENAFEAGQGRIACTRKPNKGFNVSITLDRTLTSASTCTLKTTQADEKEI